MFRRFGSKVTIIERGSRLIGREDENVSQTVKEIFDAEKIDMIFNADTIKAYKNDDNTITVTTTKDGDNVTGTHLLLAIGRVPNTDLLGLENTSIEKNNRGFINVNEYCQTNVEGIYAMGDCKRERRIYAYFIQ